MSVSAEYEDQRTLDWLISSLSAHGTVIDMPWDQDFGERLSKQRPDVIFNITEATGGRNRESLVPAIAESLGIPCTGSDALAMGLSLHKHYAKVLAASVGVPCPVGFPVVSGTAEDLHLDNVSLPAIVKPLFGGSSMGISQKSKATTREELYEAIRSEKAGGEECVEILIEKFIRGREFAVAIIDRGTGPEVLPIAEIVVDGGDPDAFYTIDRKSKHQKELVCPADVETETASLLSDYSLRIFNALGCRDLARIDFRVDREGQPLFLEINPLPGLSPYYGIYPVQAEAGGVPPDEVITHLLSNALMRRKETATHVR